ncbi:MULTISPECIES: dicarboxylate/amino acid:cation symporter [Dethiosulfovibrio]|uniref:Dicarboxylate/amino acid:cation symporter n=2 Tax=Dethiosulfovibrio TaxID=47054 RepID=A0ABS9ENZ0_9BACT|nr:MULTISPECIES: dicarboxylate/amino acid:cation symporter [Dethiosulfovibrio]MCF4114426.1 dicarboxylate/amino acid:cation symporter [Dethiosulfovibrio russensis]MCF4142913.1 dicarboxylate/amino acid:cation symporter [Dethiosulfovibrio marinus]MCF4145010.1 dicarboxylate/amino acid:cation symporter [Dethiosulfovibrio acidaminovorans]
MSQTRKKIPLIWKITIGFVLGIVAGVMIGPKVAVVEPIGKIFITLLKMLIVPLVFSSLVVGVSSIGDPKTLGRIGIKTILLYLGTTAVAIVIGLSMGHFFQPGAGMNIENVTAVSGKTAPTLAQVVIGMFPSNPVQALAQGHMLQIIVFSLFFGIAAVLAGEKGKPILSVMDSIAETMYKVTELVMSLAPYGVFALIAVTVSKYGISVLAPFAKVIGAVYLGCIAHAIIVYSGLVSLVTKKSPTWFFSGIKEASITAFVTRSSSATLPVTMTCTQENMGVSEKISSFVLPLGATINMDGTALYQGVCALFIAQAFGIDLSLGAQVGIIVTATLASIGTAGVPGAGLIMLTLVVTQAGLPMEGVALVAGIDAVLDMARTSLNVTGDACITTVVAKTEGELSL